MSNLTLTEGKETVYEGSPVLGDIDYSAQYLDKIAKIPILDRRQEKRIAREYKKYKEAARVKVADQLTAYIDLTGDKETDKGIQHSNEKIERTNNEIIEKNISVEGRRAKNLLIEHTMRWVAKIARGYTHNGVEIDDLVSAGADGLRKAVEHFDPEMNFRLTTYSTWWIKNCINKCISDYGRSVRIPVHHIDLIRKLRRIERKIVTERGYQPDDEELAKEMDVGIERIAELRNYAEPVISLDNQTIGKEGEMDRSRIVDVLSKDEDVEKDVRDWMSHAYVRYVLSCLEPRQHAVIVLRHGLYSDKPCTLQETADKLKLSRETVRVIQSQAEKVLLHSPEMLELREEIIGKTNEYAELMSGTV